MRATETQLVGDIAQGYDAVVMGADKWAQVDDLGFYGSAAARDAVVAALPPVLVAPRPPDPVPDHALVLDVHPDLAEHSSTHARAGRRELMAPEAIAFDDLTGAWTDAQRYEQWLNR